MDYCSAHPMTKQVKIFTIKATKPPTLMVRKVSDEQTAKRAFSGLYGYDRIEFLNEIRFYSPACTKFYNWVFDKNIRTWKTIYLEAI